jgi:DNA mismatch repair protein MutS
VLETLHNGNRCRAIFATHFHELFQLAEALPRLKPHTMRVKEFRGEVVFMHEVIPGAAQRSWGVHVARLAGVPEPVAKRADILLKVAERTAPASEPLPLFAAAPAQPDESDAVLVELERLDPDQMSPRDALEALYALRRRFAPIPAREASD